MPTYRITDPDTGRTVKLTGTSPPTEEELNDIFSKLPAAAAAPKPEPEKELIRPVTGFRDPTEQFGELLRKGEIEPSGLQKKIGAFGGGFAEGATLGAVNLIPGVKGALEKAKKESPVLFGAGQVGSFFTPGTGQARVFKGTGKLIGKLAGKFAPKLGKVAKTAAQAGVTGGITEGVRGATEEGKIDVVRGLKRGAIAAPVEAFTGGALKAAGPLLKKAAPRLLQASLKPTKALRKKGFEAQGLIEHKTVGLTLGSTLKKTRKKIADADNQLSQILDNYVKKNPDKKFNANAPFEKLKAKLKKSQVDELFGDEEIAIKELDNILDKATKRGLTGEIDVKQLRDLKGLIGRRAFKKMRGIQPDEDIAKRTALKILWTDLIEEMNNTVSKAKKPNKVMSDLIPGKEVLKEAIEKKGNNFKIGLRDLLILVGGGTAGGVPGLGVGVAAVGAKKVFVEGPRGALITGAAGKLAEAPAAQRGFSGLAGRAATRGRFKKEEEEEKKIKPFKGRGSL